MGRQYSFNPYKKPIIFAAKMGYIFAYLFLTEVPEEIS